MKDLSVFITVVHVYRHIYNHYKVTIIENIASEFMLLSLSVTVKLM